MQVRASTRVSTVFSGHPNAQNSTLEPHREAPLFVWALDSIRYVVWDELVLVLEFGVLLSRLDVCAFASSSLLLSFPS